MKMRTQKILGHAAAIVAVTLAQSALRAGTSTNSSGQPTQQGIGNPAITISFSGQTALRNFNTSGAFTELQPGTSIILHDGPGGAPVTYTAPNTGGTFVQLASPNFGFADVGINNPSAQVQQHSAVRLEWHEQGSIDGFYDLINDQIGYVQVSQGGSGPISNSALRPPSSSNATWINTNKFTTGTSTNGFTLDSSAGDNLADTYNTSVYDQATGVNIQGGQNRIQFSVGENPVEAVAVNGTANPFASAGSAGYGRGNTALQSASTLTALGVGGARQQFQPSLSLNESTDKIDPQTGAAYAVGPWNTAGANNVTSTSVSASAVTFSANPGTGLQRVDKGDAQWLQTTGHLQNGAVFNVVARTVDTGQRVVFALATGVDPSWAAGSNDDGNSTSTTAANAQHSVGASLRFDGKTSGTEAATTIGASRLAVGALSVSEARGASSAAPVRALDVDFNDQTSDGSDPTKFIRANFDTIVSSNAATRYQAVLISHYNTIKAPNPTALLNEEKALGFIAAGDNNVSHATDTAVVSAANQQIAWAKVSSFDPATAETDSTPANAPVSGIKGDVHGDVAAVLSNIINSVATSSSGVSVPASANNPADGLESVGYVPAGLLNYTRDTDGGPITPVTLSSAAQAQQNLAKQNYAPLFTTDLSSGSNAQTIGSSAFYGGGTSSNGVAINGAIPITAKETNGTADGNGVIAPAGNYLFGNFNQNGVRDYSAVQSAVGAALALTQQDVVAHGGKNSIFTGDSGVTNTTTISSLSAPLVNSSTNTKGDLITLGDFNGDGKFDGQDLYLLATGASLADSSSSVTSALNSTATLTASATTFANAVRSPNAVLFKNTALDYVQNDLNNAAGTNAQAVAFLKQSGRAVLTTSGAVPAGATDLHTTDPVNGLEQYTWDPNGVNAFNKFDVNRDGRVSLNDLSVVNKFIGTSTTNLIDQVSATIAVDGSVNNALPQQQQFNLFNASLIDNKAANGLQANILGHGASANNGAGPTLLFSAANGGDGLSRSRNILRTDFNLLAANLIASGQLDTGDVTLDGKVDGNDVTIVLNDFGNVADSPLLSLWTQGDISDAAGDSNGDGKVDGFDVAAVLNDFGDVSNALAVFNQDDISKFDVAFNPTTDQFVEVPEPTSLSLLAVGGLMLARRRRAST
jgi:hypothetical protein